MLNIFKIQFQTCSVKIELTILEYKNYKNEVFNLFNYFRKLKRVCLDINMLNLLVNKKIKVYSVLNNINI